MYGYDEYMRKVVIFASLGVISLIILAFLFRDIPQVSAAACTKLPTISLNRLDSTPVISGQTMGVGATIDPNAEVQSGTGYYFEFIDSSGNSLGTASTYNTSQRNYNLVVPPIEPGTNASVRVSGTEENTLCEASGNLSITISAPQNNEQDSNDGSSSENNTNSTISGESPSAEIISPDGLIDSNEENVKIRFNNLPDGAKFCLLSDQQECENNVLKGNGKLLISREEAGISNNDDITVCGNKDKKLKTECDSGDWFHAGSIYRIGAYIVKNEAPVLVALAEFYVHHYYPDVTIHEGLEFGFNKDTGSTSRILFKNSDKPPGVVEISNPITVTLSGRQTAGGEKRNNYQIVLEGVDNDYKSGFIHNSTGERCVVIGEDGVTETIADERNGNSAFPTGKYILKINEQINDTGFANRYRHLDLCQGGFTLYEIPINIDSEGNAYVDTRWIEADPNMSELQHAINQQQLDSGLPCAQWVNAKGEDVDETDPTRFQCGKYETAIFAFSTNPLEFIRDAGSFLLTIGIMAAFARILYAGYIILTSRGDKEKISRSRELITSSVTGLIFLILSIAILEIIGIDILQIPGFERGS